jgi:hypothetical protein
VPMYLPSMKTRCAIRSVRLSPGILAMARRTGGRTRDLNHPYSSTEGVSGTASRSRLPDSGSRSLKRRARRKGRGSNGLAVRVVSEARRSTSMSEGRYTGDLMPDGSSSRGTGAACEASPELALTVARPRTLEIEFSTRPRRGDGSGGRVLIPSGPPDRGRIHGPLH